MKYISKGIMTLKWINEIKDPTHWQKLYSKHLLGYSNSTPQNHDHVIMSKTSLKIVSGKLYTETFDAEKRKKEKYRISTPGKTRNI